MVSSIPHFIEIAFDSVAFPLFKGANDTNSEPNYESSISTPCHQKYDECSDYLVIY